MTFGKGPLATFARLARLHTVPLTRRNFVQGAAALTGATILEGAAPLRAAAQLASSASPLLASIDYDKPGRSLPANFTGLGYEISSVARKGLLEPHNSVYVELVRSLGRSGVIRVGGNTSDFSRYAPGGPAVSSPKATAVTAADLHDLGGFLQATGWQLIWGLNLGGERSPEDLANALEEAEAVVRYCGPHLLAIEIGNEPDLFSIEHRPKPYTYEQFRHEYEPIRDALLKRLPNVPLAGPDVASATDWVARFAADEKPNLKLLTHHYYRGGQSDRTSSSAELLSVDPHLAPMLAAMQAASTAAGLPYRLCEVNSFSGGGKPGVSDTFTQALWVLDYMLRLAEGGAAGVNIETGVNQLGFISSYSPIADDEHDRYTAAPGYYGMLAFAQLASPAGAQSGNQAGTSRLLPVSLGAGPLNVTAYAVEHSATETVLALINREPLSAASIRLPQRPGTTATLLQLQAPALSATRGIALGGIPVSMSGTWRAPAWKPVTPEAEAFRIDLTAASATLVRLVRA